MTDEEIRRAVLGIKTDPNTIAPIARAIESAATAPLLAEIDRLKKRLAYANEVIDQRNAMLEAQAAQRVSYGFEQARAEGAFSTPLPCCPTWYATALRREGWEAAISATPAAPSQEEPRHMWDGSPVPNYTITREQ